MKDFHRLEFFRSGFGLLPDPEDKDPGVVLSLSFIAGAKIAPGQCTCRAFNRSKACAHRREMAVAVSEFLRHTGDKKWEDFFGPSLWNRLGYLFWQGDQQPLERVRPVRRKSKNAALLLFHGRAGELLARFFNESQATMRFLERLGLAPADLAFADRAAVLNKLGLLLRTPEERKFNESGVRSRRQSYEESFWGRLAYHCFREFGDDKGTFHPAVDEGSGDFFLTYQESSGEPLISMVVPRKQVRSTLKLLSGEFPKQKDLEVHPIPLKSLFKVSQSTRLDLEVRHVIEIMQATGESRFLEDEELRRFRYGDLIYIPEMRILAQLETSRLERKFAAPVSMKLARSQLPSFLSEHAKEIEAGEMIMDGPLRRLRLIKEYDYLEVVSTALRRSWYWLSICYGFGEERIPLIDILKAKQQGRSHLETAGGWIDLSAPAFSDLDRFLDREDILSGRGSGTSIRLSPMELLRFVSSVESTLRISASDQRASLVERFLALRPAEPFVEQKKAMTPLRPYQRIGVDWLCFLYENKLGGLLCDDMGLGKTHQAMALMIWLRKKMGVRKPVLVVAPTSVISHWRDKIREHAPALKAEVYHGSQRNLRYALSKGHVLITSYGLLRNDLVPLRKARFELAIFDEIQCLKNRETQSYQAARLLNASVKLGLTGTPIENSIDDLKSLFDLILPGYLGSDEEFARKFADTPENLDGGDRMVKLKRIVAPFMLRRIKQAVLDELPEKIEDIRSCRLSEVQARLYRDVLASKGNALVELIRAKERRLPYIHIFAVLNHLKRICDHPALALNQLDQFEKYPSGKWELLQELLFESLDSGQKVVVFTQYLGMIWMMERLLRTLEIGFVSLTGGSADRGEIVRRFNEEKDCRVFLGSLKAGGTGIDLIAGTVVIHYDRWWNAAREDQATDRCHRIGQKKVVQVFKLIAEGTLEEKISAIIERKRRLMEAVVRPDNPRLQKIFTRDELIDLLSPV